MKKLGHLKENIVTALEIPEDLAYREVLLTVTGRESVIIENYKSILKYTAQEVELLTFRGRLKLCGKNLEILSFTPEEMQIKGRICGIFFES